MYIDTLIIKIILCSNALSQLEFKLFGGNMISYYYHRPIDLLTINYLVKY